MYCYDDPARIDEVLAVVLDDALNPGKHIDLTSYNEISEGIKETERIIEEYLSDGEFD